MKKSWRTRCTQAALVACPSARLSPRGVTSTSWPLIGYLHADPVYRARYDAHVRDITEGPFENGAMLATYRAYATLVEPYATTETPGFTFLRSSGEFLSAMATLEAHAGSRTAAAAAYDRTPAIRRAPIFQSAA